MGTETGKAVVVADNAFRVTCLGDETQFIHEPVDIEMERTKTGKMRRGRCRMCGRTFVSFITRLGY